MKFLLILLLSLISSLAVQASYHDECYKCYIDFSICDRINSASRCECLHDFINCDRLVADMCVDNMMTIVGYSNASHCPWIYAFDEQMSRCSEQFVACRNEMPYMTFTPCRCHSEYNTCLDNEYIKFIIGDKYKTRCLPEPYIFGYTILLMLSVWLCGFVVNTTIRFLRRRRQQVLTPTIDQPNNQPNNGQDSQQDDDDSDSSSSQSESQGMRSRGSSQVRDD